jgi:hypothetical protein
VIKDLVAVQRSFLWGGGRIDKKICWVSWNRVCEPKVKGGLGIKNLELFNYALLCKWKWRCLIDKEASWYDLLKFRYGSFANNFLHGEGKEKLKTSSIWWRDLWYLGGLEDGGWFGSNICSTLGDGKDLSFWRDKWLGTVSLFSLFPTLYTKSDRKDGTISEMGLSSSNNWSWALEWTADLADEEEESVQELNNMLDQVRPSCDKNDRRRWLLSSTGIFSVKSAYEGLQSRFALDCLEEGIVISLKKLWKNNVPSKISIFGWRLLLEKLPTRGSLFEKGILTNSNDRPCVFCFHNEESIAHVFIHCKLL